MSQEKIQTSVNILDIKYNTQRPVQVFNGWSSPIGYLFAGAYTIPWDLQKKISFFSSKITCGAHYFFQVWCKSGAHNCVIWIAERQFPYMFTHSSPACAISLNNCLERMDWTQQAWVDNLLFMESAPAAWFSCESACVPIIGANFQTNIILLLYSFVSIEMLNCHNDVWNWGFAQI